MSRLDHLAGIGPGRRRLLLQRFGSLAGVQRATREELQAALGPRLGDRIHAQLHAPPPLPETPAPGEVPG